MGVAGTARRSHRASVHCGSVSDRHPAAIALGRLGRRRDIQAGPEGTAGARLTAIVKLTNIYLSAQEYEVLRILPGRELRKTRWRSSYAAGRLVVDEFDGPLSGLVLAELELRPGEAPLALVPAADVSEDDRFSGGRLAGLSASAAASLLTRARTLLHPNWRRHPACPASDRFASGSSRPDQRSETAS